MAAANLSNDAKEAFLDDNFIVAVDLYTQAINLDPQNAYLFADRAQANIKLNNFTESVADANKAIELDPLMAKAYLRKGTACINLGKYQTAKSALVTGSSLMQNDPRFTKLIEECDGHIAVKKGDQNNALSSSSLLQISDMTDGKLQEVGQGEDNTCQKKVMAVDTPKYRHAFYQKPEEVVVTIFAKGIPEKFLSVDFGEQILSVTIDLPDENIYCFQPRLFGKIVPEKCRYEVLATKVEIRLTKAESINWTSLECNDKVAVPQKINASSAAVQRPTYPSSNPRGTNWDELVAQVKKEEKEEKLDGDAALNKMFGAIYGDADEDMRRAMTKSYVESNGTVLSTDWKDVGSKKVEGSAPDGMQLKKWEY